MRPCGYTYLLPNLIASSNWPSRPPASLLLPCTAPLPKLQPHSLITRSESIASNAVRRGKRNVPGGSAAGRKEEERGCAVKRNHRCLQRWWEVEGLELLEGIQGGKEGSGSKAKILEVTSRSPFSFNQSVTYAWSLTCCLCKYFSPF